MIRALLLLGLFGVATGCSHGAAFVPIDRLQRVPPADASRFSYQVLWQSEHFTFEAGRHASTEFEFHYATRVLNPSGLDDAQLQLPYLEAKNVVSIAGRVISPDGQIELLDQSQVHWADAQGGEIIHGEEAPKSFAAARLPNAQVGSILEWAFVLRRDEALSASNHQQLDNRAPIAHYELGVSMSDRFHYEARAYRSDRKFEESAQDGMREVRWSVDDVPGLPREQNAMPTAPAWSMRLSSLQFGGLGGVGVQGSWADVFADRVAHLNRVSRPDVHLSLDVSRCTISRCRIEEAWKTVHRLTDTHFRMHSERQAFWGIRPLSQVLEGRTASDWEQAVLFRALLATVGIPTDPIFAVHRYNDAFDPTFPLDSTQDVLVFVRPLPGLPKGLIVDPSCEACVPGQLRDELDGSHGVWAHVEYAPDGSHDDKAEVIDLSGEPKLENRISEVDRVKVSRTGDVSVDERKLWFGDFAAITRSETQPISPGQWKTGQQKALGDRLPIATSRSETRPTCEKRLAQCEASSRFDAHGLASVSDEELVLPLSFLDVLSNDLFADPERSSGFVFASHAELSDTAEIEVPKGWVIASPCADQRRESGPFIYELTCQAIANTVHLNRRLSIAPGQFPKEAYPDARAVVRAFTDLRDQSLVFKPTAAHP